jgi:hypothetical protein
MARSILQQLVLADRTVEFCLLELANKTGYRSLCTNRTAIEALSVCLKAVGSVSVIVDGIDECHKGDQKYITDFWLKYADGCRSETNTSRFVMISRDDGITRPLLGGLPLIRVQGPNHEADIRSYCEHRANEIRQMFDLDEKETTSLALKSSDHAQGMFLLAKLIMENLSMQTTRSEIAAEMTMERFPPGLGESYVT